MSVRVELNQAAVKSRPDLFGDADLHVLASSSYERGSCPLADSYQAPSEKKDSAGFWNLFPLLFGFSVNRESDASLMSPDEARLRDEMLLHINVMERSSGSQKLFSRLQASILQVHLAGIIYRRIVRVITSSSFLDIGHSLDDANGLIIRAETLADSAGVFGAEAAEMSEVDLKWYELRFAEALTRIHIFIANVTHTPDAYHRAVSELKTLVERLLDSHDVSEHRLAKLIFDANRERFDGVFRQKIVLLIKELNVQMRNKGAFRIITYGLPVLIPKMPFIENKFCDELHLKLRLSFLNNNGAHMYQILRLRAGMNEVERQMLRKLEKK